MPRPTHVIAPEGCARYLTPGRRYQIERWEAEDLFIIGADPSPVSPDRECWCTLTDCAHLNGGDWLLPPDPLLEVTVIIADLLPYATAAVGLPRASWPADSVLLRAEAFLAANKKDPTP